ncbi:cytochrome c maturation protein CcmE [Yanghanlia caeni]|uniref:Cytochrome c-type biogenesis protein CcmE n=1 Tax=Yanghanlia caeni TaxID=3064283 RepID=A0ABU1D9G3_9BURK|nr:cytochrome c maturation protein CcmE [Alcaligenaceae bacterium LG-2]
MKARHKRFALIGGGIATLGIATALVLNAFQDNLVFFFTPAQVIAGEAPKERTFRVGGMVQTGSVQRDGLTVNFVVTDSVQTVSVLYTGILPDLFSEGKGVVAQGKLDGNGQFRAEQVLAKHDENYMPREAQHAIDQATQNAEGTRL